MEIRPAAEADLPALLAVFETAKAFMAAHGNPTQWGPGYPGEALLQDQIRRGVCYVVEADGQMAGTFCCLPGADPSYAQIEGAWPEDVPYLTIHRLASSGRVHGVARACIDWCAARGLALRIDTHRDNLVMQRMLQKNGFVYCGVIHLAENGEPRLAYHRPARRPPWTPGSKSPPRVPGERGGARGGAPGAGS